MDNQRRKFLKIAGASALAGIGAPTLVKLTAGDALAAAKAPADGHGAAAKDHGPEVPAGIRLAMVIDMRVIAAKPHLLDKAITACNEVHNIPDFGGDRKNEIKWLWKASFEAVLTDKSYTRLSKMVQNTDFPVLCNHCANPPCVRACPTKATFKLEKNGIVAMDYHRCIGCRFCMAACPYGARSFNWQDPRPFVKKYNNDFPTRMRGVVEKCNFCSERLALGQEPACVEACEGAITFGDINDPHSEISKVLDKEFTIQRKPTLGTNPSVFYIV